MSISVLICDDDSLIRESLKILLPLKGDIKIEAEAADGQEAIDICTSKQIDVALIDIRMVNVNGPEAIKQIVKRTDTKCLVLTTFDEDEYVSEAMDYGAKGYMLKNSSPDQIANAIVSVYNNTIVLNEVILGKLHNNINKPSFNKNLFTDREKDIVIAISEGLNNKEISKKLFISEGTVRNYITSILEKTGLEHRTAIAVNFLKGEL